MTPLFLFVTGEYPSSNGAGLGTGPNLRDLADGEEGAVVGGKEGIGVAAVHHTQGRRTLAGVAEDPTGQGAGEAAGGRSPAVQAGCSSQRHGLGTGSRLSIPGRFLPGPVGSRSLGAPGGVENWTEAFYHHLPWN